MAYESAEVLLDRCPGDGHFLVRITGSCARTHQGGQKRDMTQRTKAGCCPCCARPIHVAAPFRYQAGEYSWRKAHGIRLRRQHGPWAVRYFGCLVLKPPALFDGHFGALRKKTSRCPLPELPGRFGGKSAAHGPPAQRRPTPTRRNLAPSSPRPRPKQFPGNCVQSDSAAKPSQCLSTSRRTSWRRNSQKVPSRAGH